MSKKKGLLVLLLSAWVGFCLVWFFSIYNKEEDKKQSGSDVTTIIPPSIAERVDSTPPTSGEQQSSLKEEEQPAQPSKIIPASSTETQEQNTEEEVKSITENTNSANTENSVNAEADKNKKSTDEIKNIVAPENELPAADNTRLVGILHFNRKLNTGVKIFPPGMTKKLLEVLKSPDTYIIVTGHTDPSGSKEYNYKLGLKRAEKVKSILVKKGITSDRIKVFSKGEENPITTNKTARGKQRNRRVEIAVSKSF